MIQCGAPCPHTHKNLFLLPLFLHAAPTEDDGADGCSHSTNTPRWPPPGKHRRESGSRRAEESCRVGGLYHHH
uniref:Putative secreted protein n=1 Tax=Anopheles darlingi TaxID=43151 RepID=A0A2M4DE12_ANODA